MFSTAPCLAHEIQPLRSIRWPRAFRVEYFDLPEIAAQRCQNAPHRKGSFLNTFANQFIVVPLPLLKDFHVPFEKVSAPAVHFDDHEIPAELINPGRTVCEALQFADGIDVEDKNAAAIEMGGDAAKGSPPVGKSMQMIDRVESANYGIESAVNAEMRHVLLEQADMPQPLSRDREH
ncbi:MAG TPA: hypothetical protein VFQ89_04920, partial [Candidatus Binatia bacterium]|nr:hypothetical protein [Candidatus Binatia bacterium]